MQQLMQQHFTVPVPVHSFSSTACSNNTLHHQTCPAAAATCNPLTPAVAHPILAKPINTTPRPEVQYDWNVPNTPCGFDKKVGFSAAQA